MILNGRIFGVVAMMAFWSISGAFCATGDPLAVPTFHCIGLYWNPEEGHYSDPWTMEEFMTDTEYDVIEYGATPNNGRPDTVAIQSAIDACAAAGGGIVKIPAGTFLSGALIVRNNITLRFEDGAILKGSDNYLDYGEGKWSDALIKGENAQNIRFEGKGMIDGIDCRNPDGEEGFRGPHGILLDNCANIAVEDVTMQNIGNYAILCRNSINANLRNVSVRGGHDGLHAQACSRFNVYDCDFRTGDDCLAGCDNVDFEVVNCIINSSCNGFRLGCLNLGEELPILGARRVPTQGE